MSEENRKKLRTLVAYFKKRHKETPFLGFAEDYKWGVLTRCKTMSSLEIARVLSKSPCNFIYQMDMQTLAFLSKNKPNDLSEVLDMLRDESIDLRTRLAQFRHGMDALCEDGQSKPGDERTAAAFLTCFYPQKYTFYMSSKVYDPFRKYLGVDKPKGESHYVHFLQIIQPLVEIVAEDKELQDIFLTLSKDNESSNLLSAQTILWCMNGSWDKIPESNMFTWIPFYQELAGKLLQYKNNRKDLLAWAYSDLKGYTNAMHDGGKPFQDIDPFTIMGLFNRQPSAQTRLTILGKFKKHFEINATLPEDFDGIPILNAINSNFTANTSDPKYVNGCEDMIWNLLDAIVNNPSEVENYFNQVRTLPYVNNKMTMAMFWCRPYDYLALDKNNRDKLARYDIATDSHVPDFAGYSAILDALRAKMESKEVKDPDFPHFSHNAWAVEEETAAAEDPYRAVVALWKSKKNIILQGAPGTGKTYAVPECVVRLCNDLEPDVYDRDSIMEEYKKLVDEKRVVFTTFHQSMDYESFVEGIKAKVDESDSISYQVEDGLFKELCVNARNSGVADNTKFGFNEDSTVWKVSLAGTYENEVRSECLKNGHIRIGWDKYGAEITEETDWSIYNGEGKSILDAFYNKMQLGDIVFSCYSSKTIDAIGVITGEPEYVDSYQHYKRVRKVDWIWKAGDQKKYDIFKANGDKAMTLGTVYRLKSISVEKVVEILSDLKVKGTHKAKTDAKPYVVVIDEINRGNISKIFGELITLLETDKRGGETNEVSVKLPYSREKFSVPSNVYILGTMNTADRSVGYIDYAIRRRFAFHTLMANANDEIGQYYADHENEALGQIATELFSDVQDFVTSHISIDFDADDLMIGHSYFMAESEEELEMKKQYEIRPLLMEYMRDGILMNVNQQQIDDCLNFE